MLIVAGTISVEPSARDDVLQAVAPMVEATRAEDGCLAYVFSPDPGDPGVVRLYELWDGQDSLDAHFASPHMAEWQARSAELPILGRDIAKYTIAEVGPVR